MKGLNIVAIAGGVLLLGVGITMAVTNPTQDQYEEFATEELSRYLKTSICPKAPKILGLQSQCPEFVDSNRSKIRQIITQNTQQQNFIFFSLYKTDLSAGSFIPSYHFETVGVLQNFHVYQVKRQ